MAASLAGLPNDLLGSGDKETLLIVFLHSRDGMVCHFVQPNEEIKRPKVWGIRFA